MREVIASVSRMGGKPGREVEKSRNALESRKTNWNPERQISACISLLRFTFLWVGYPAEETSVFLS